MDMGLGVEKGVLKNESRSGKQNRERRRTKDRERKRTSKRTNICIGPRTEKRSQIVN